MGTNTTSRQPSTPLHPGPELYAQFRAALILRQTTLQAECREICVSRENARKCLRGEWTGPGANRLLDTLCERAGIATGRFAVSSDGWLSVDDLAAAARVHRNTALKVMRRALQGKSWRGMSMRVRRVPGRGRTGRTYQVALESLPADLQNSHRSAETA